MERGDRPPGCSQHGPECQGNCAGAHEKSKEMLRQLGDLHQQIVQALRERFELEGPLGQYEWAVVKPDGNVRAHGTAIDRNASLKEDSKFIISLREGPKGSEDPNAWNWNFTVDGYRARPEHELPYTARLAVSHENKIEDEIELEFSYQEESPNKITAFSKPPRIKRFDGNQVIGMQDDGVHLGPRARGLAKKPEPTVMSHQEFQNQMEAHLAYLGLFLREFSSSSDKVPKGGEKVSLAKKKPKSVVPEPAQPSKGGGISLAKPGRSKISLARKKPGT